MASTVVTDTSGAGLTAPSSRPENRNVRMSPRAASSRSTAMVQRILRGTVVKENLEVGNGDMITSNGYENPKCYIQLQQYNADRFSRDLRGGAVYAFATMRIAKPILLVSTPVGVVFGLIEAWRVGAWLGTLMLALLGVLSGFSWLTVRRIRAEREGEPRDDR